MTVKIGIVTYNSITDLPACFAGLAQQTFRDFEVAVLDNASTDGSADWVRSQQRTAFVIQSPVNLGFARGHNRILAELALGESDFYMPLNPDVKLRPDYLQHLLASFEGPRIGWATGKLLQPRGQETRIYSLGHALRRDGYAFNIGHGLPEDEWSGQSREVFGAPGAAPLFRAELIHALEEPLFDDSMFMYYEDVDLDWRARRGGWLCWYCAQAVAVHRGSQADEWLRTEALANRFVSVLKNAFWVDLLSYNLPLMAVHMAVRLLLSPKQGGVLLLTVLRRAPAALRRRRKPHITRRQMRHWFRWAQRQPTGQPTTFWARLRTFLRLLPL